MCILVFSTAFVWNISRSKTKWARYDQKLILVYVWSAGYCCLIFHEIWIFIQIFKQYSNIKFRENPSSGSRVSDCCQTVRQTYVNHVFDAWPCKKPTNQITLEIIDRVKLADFMAFSFIISLRLLLVLFLNHCVYCCMFCVLLFNSVRYVFLLLCVLCSVYSVFVVPAGTLRLPWLRGFPCFFLSCKANARVKPAKTGHGLHSCQIS